MSDCRDCGMGNGWPGYSMWCRDCIKRALTHAGVWADDSQIDSLLIERAPTLGGMLKVEVEAL